MTWGVTHSIALAQLPSGKNHLLGKVRLFSDLLAQHPNMLHDWGRNAVRTVCISPVCVRVCAVVSPNRAEQLRIA